MLVASKDWSGEDLARLDALTELALAVFEDCGAQIVDPGQILSAENLLNLYGEDIRSRAFVFEGGDAGALCLRPDLTLSLCRLHLGRAATATQAKYAASGPVFRHPTQGENRAAQFRQVGCEWFGGDDAVSDEADVFAAVARIINQAGCADVRVVTGDLGIIFSMLDAAPIPERWRARLKRHIWRPERFRTLLHELSSEGTQDQGRIAFLKAVGGLQTDQAKAAVSHMLALSNTTHVGLRTHDEIAARFLEQAEDARAHPLSTELVTAIEAVTLLKTSCASALIQLKEIAQTASLSIDAALDQFERRLAALDAHGIDVNALPFEGDFGRNLEYYDGFVFEFYDAKLADDKGHRAAQLAGGGRYDAMLSAAARVFNTPSVAAQSAFGAAIRPETLLDITNRRSGV